MLNLVSRLSLVALVWVLAGCPIDRAEPLSRRPARDEPQPAAATHTGIISIQDMAIANLPQAGHGLTVQAIFTPLRQPDVLQAVPNTPFGCRATAYDLAAEPPPREEDQGELTIEGLRGGPIGCAFREGRGYLCQTANGEPTGTGPTPDAPHGPFAEGTKVRVALAADGGGDFESFERELRPGAAFVLDAATQRQIVAVEPDGRAIELGCAGDGGECGPAAASVIRITTTDGDTTGLSPVAMPPAKHWAVEIQCAFPETGVVAVPAEAMQLLRMAHERSPITRIRTAFMREGFAVSTNPAPQPANSVIVLVGHGVLGFSNPAP